MWKRTIALAFLVAAFLFALPMESHATEIVDSGETTWRNPNTDQVVGHAFWVLDSDGLLTVDGEGSIGVYTSQERLYPWNGYRANITTLSISGSFTSIEACAFSSCPNISTISFGDDCRPTTFGVKAFSGCTSLTSVQIPDSVTSIGENAFNGGTSLTSVQIPDSVTYIGKGAFAGCTSLTSVQIPDSVTKIDNYAFSNCTSLLEVKMSGSVNTIGDQVFRSCMSATFYVPTVSARNVLAESFHHDDMSIGSYFPKPWSIKGSYSTLGGIRYATDADGNAVVLGLTSDQFSSITIPSSVGGKPVVGIGTYSFCNYSSLTSVRMPDSITYIGRYAFEGCSGLTSIEIPDSVTSLYDRAFAGCTSLVSVTIPDSVTLIETTSSAYRSYVFIGCTSIAAVNLPGSTTALHRDDFIDSPDAFFYVSTKAVYNKVPSDKSHIKGLNTTPEGARYMTDGDSAIILGIVDGSVVDLVIPESIDGKQVTAIGDYSFDGCTGLASVRIPETVTSIGVSAFSGCENLASVELPGSRTSIASATFASCGNAVFYVSTRAVYDMLVFSGISESRIKGLNTTPEGIRYMTDGDSAIILGIVDGSVEDLVIPETIEGKTVAAIGDYSFYNCTSLASATIPDSVTSIGESAFQGCSGLAEVTICGSLSALGIHSFIGLADPSTVNVADEEVYEALVGNPNFISTDRTSIVLVLIKDIADCQAQIGSGFIYTGGEVKPVPTVTDGDEELVLGTDYTLRYWNNIEPGNASLFIDGFGRYSGTLEVPFEIEKITVPVPSEDATEYVYDGTEKTYVVAESDLYTVSGDKRTDAGTQAVFVELVDSAHYKWADGWDGEFAFEVKPAPVTVTVENKAKGQGDDDPRFTAVEAGLLNGDSIQYTFSREPGEEPGEYAISATGEALQGNYQVSFIDGVLTILEESPFTVAVTDAEKVYDGAKLSTTATPSVVEGTLVEYSVDDGETWSEDVPSITHVGELEVMVRCTNSYYPDCTASYTLSVTKRTATIDVADASKEFGSADPVFTGQVGGLVDAADLGTVTYSRVPEDMGKEDLGDYTITASYTANSDYNVQLSNGTLTILAADISAADVEDIPDQTYAGTPIEPDPVVSFNGTTLVRGTDYEVAYEDNDRIGTATVILSGIGNYTGEREVSFQIVNGSGGTDQGGIEVAGTNRYATAAAIALKAFPDGAEGVIVATGENFPDALGASSLAGMLDWPVVLTKPSSLSAETREAIGELGAREVIVVGGEGAVSGSTFSQLASIVGKGNVTRLAGISRYETAEYIFYEGTKRGAWGSIAIVSTGTNYPDALSISGFAFAQKAPIFLCDPKQGLTQDSMEALVDLSPETVVIVGGTGAVSADVESWLASNVTPDVQRLGGKNRYETSRLIAEFVLANGGTADGACIATGQNFPDALAGGSLVGRNGSILLLADAKDTSAFSVLSAHAGAVNRVYYLGGIGAVPQSVRDAAEKAAGLQ